MRRFGEESDQVFLTVRISLDLTCHHGVATKDTVIFEIYFLDVTCYNRLDGDAQDEIEGIQDSGRWTVHELRAKSIVAFNGW